MDAKRIKERLSPTPWNVNEHSSQLIDSDFSYEIIDCDENASNAAAIVSAVNNTWGKGINPEAVKEMCDTLIHVRELIRNGIPPTRATFDRINNVLTSTKL